MLEYCSNISLQLVSRKDALQDSMTMCAVKKAQLQDVITDLDLMVQDVEAKKTQSKKECCNLEAEIMEYKLLLDAKNR